MNVEPHTRFWKLGIVALFFVLIGWQVLATIAAENYISTLQDLLLNSEALWKLEACKYSFALLALGSGFSLYKYYGNQCSSLTIIKILILVFIISSFLTFLLVQASYDGFYEFIRNS